MNDNDREVFASCLTSAAEIVGKDLSPQAIKLYWEILKKYEIEDVERAFFSHASNPDVGQFMPKPADIVKAIDGGGESRSMQAWSKVERAVRVVGPYQTVVFDDPVIHRVLSDMGGWVGFGSIEDKEMPFKANEFNKRYLGYSMRTDLQYPRKLIGIAEVHNESEDQKIAPPTFIGLPEKAQAVFDGGGKETLQITSGVNLPNLSMDRK
jgi:hypothetical protein